MKIIRSYKDLQSADLEKMALAEEGAGVFGAGADCGAQAWAACWSVKAMCFGAYCLT